jgi:hypothetical protein
VNFDAYPSVKGLRARGLEPVAPGPAITPPPIAPKAATPAGASAKLDVSFNGAPDENGNARSCPTGTVPATRPTVAEIQAAGGLSSFLSARASVAPPSGEHDCLGNTTPGPDYDHAIGYEYGGTISGLVSGISLTPPYLVQNTGAAGDHTVSQLWIQTGNCEYDTPRGGTTCNPSGQAPVQSLEVGWISGANPFVSPFFDLDDRLFVFVDNGGYGPGTGCWAGAPNETCDVFVPNPGIEGWPAATYVSGQNLGNASTLPNTDMNQDPEELWVQVWNGGSSLPYWYVWVTTSTSATWNLIGWYLGSSEFTGQMQTSATYIQLGGEVYDSYASGSHTDTSMGTGYVNFGFPVDAYQRNISFINPSNDYLTPVLTYEVCGYQSNLFYQNNTKSPAGTVPDGWGSGAFFYFGGPFGLN